MYSGAVALLITLLITVFVVVVIFLYKAKSKLEKKIRQVNDSEKIYEEIDYLPQKITIMNTEDNVAYASCIRSIETVTCAH